MRAAARVIRTEGDGQSGRKARRYSTWAAKVIATIKAVADTLMDRGVIILLRQRRASRQERGWASAAAQPSPLDWGVDYCGGLASTM
jgi:hypothetical protein